MEHTPIATPPSVGRWEQLGDDLMQLYKPLEEAMLAIHEAHPQSKHGNTTEIESADGFQRCIDMVPNIAQFTMMLDMDGHPPTAKSLLKQWKDKAPEIMKQTERMLYEYGASNRDIQRCWLVEEQVNAVFDAAEKLIGPTNHITAADLAAAAKLGQNNQKGKD